MLTKLSPQDPKQTVLKFYQGFFEFVPLIHFDMRLDGARGSGLKRKTSKSPLVRRTS